MGTIPALTHAIAAIRVVKSHNASDAELVKAFDAAEDELRQLARQLLEVVHDGGSPVKFRQLVAVRAN